MLHLFSEVEMGKVCELSLYVVVQSEVRMGPLQAPRITHLAHTYDGMFKRLLALMFPVVLPRVVETQPESWQYDEQGECGKAQHRPYRDAIDRHWRTHESS